jgi:hypothetical protein
MHPRIYIPSCPGATDPVRCGQSMHQDPRLTADEHQRYQYPRCGSSGRADPTSSGPGRRSTSVRVSTQAVDLTWDPTKEPVHDRSRHQGQPDDGRERPDPFPRQRGQPLCVPVRRSQSAGARHGYFVSVLRERIANFVDPKGPAWWTTRSGRRAVQYAGRVVRGRVDQRPAQEPAAAERVHGAAVPLDAGRYGIELDAALITRSTRPPRWTEPSRPSTARGTRWPPTSAPRGPTPSSRSR